MIPCYLVSYLTASSTKMTAFWDVAPCGLVVYGLLEQQPRRLPSSGTSFSGFRVDIGGFAYESFRSQYIFLYLFLIPS
jgi:hypothetical protein